jgi:tetratricopeptide (TPR) repeat protein
MSTDKRGVTPPTEPEGDVAETGGVDEMLRSVVISAPGESGPILIGTIALRRKGTSYSLQRASGRSAPPELSKQLDVLLAPLLAPDRSGPIEPRWTEAIEAMRAAGWTVEDGTTDLSIKLTIDGRTGQVLAMQGPAHPLAERDPQADAAISKRVRDAVAENFQTRAREHAASVAAAVTAGRMGELGPLLAEASVFAQLFPQRTLLEALRNIDVDAIDHETAVAVLEQRIQLADGLRDYVDLDRDVQRFLTLTGRDKDPKSLVQLLVVRANSAGQQQLRESAAALFRAALRAIPQPDDLTRAWAHRGLATLAECGSSEWESHEEQGMEAFLIGGNQLEAVTSAVAIAHVRVRHDHDAALALLAKATGWLSTNDPIGKELLASLYHERAQMLFNVHRFRDARADAEQAAELRDGIYGAELARVASLELAAFAAERVGDHAAVSAFRARAAAEHARHPNAKADLDRRLAASLHSDGWPGVARLRDVIEASGDARLRVTLRSLEAVMSGDLAFADKLALLDSTRPLLESLPRRRAESLRQQVFASYALVFEQERDGQRALEYHQKVLALAPFDSYAIGRTASLLAQLERWADAVVFAEKCVDQFGRLPGWLFYLGRALFKAGRPQDAFPVLREAEGLAKDPTALSGIRALKEEVLNACSEPPKPAPPAPPPTAVSRDYFEAVLRDFSTYVSGEKRMTFWRARKDRKGHEWAPNPEQRGKDLLQTFLNAKFGELLESLEEVKAGAGRIDLYLVFSGGLRVVVELKMCGGGYSTSYALDGIDQLLHYLDQKRTSLGYLVVFDGRLDMFGTGLPAPGALGPKVIVPICVDLRPKVKTPSSGKRATSK